MKNNNEQIEGIKEIAGIRDSAIKEYVALRGEDARKDVALLFFCVIALFALVILAVLMFKDLGIIPPIPIELKTCWTQQILQ